MSSTARSGGEVGPGDGGEIGSFQESCHLYYAAYNVLSISMLFHTCLDAVPPLGPDRLLPFPALGMAPSLVEALENLESVVNKRKEPEAVKAFQSLKKELPAVVSLPASEMPVVGQL